MFEDSILLKQVLVLLTWFIVSHLLIHLLVELLLVLKLKNFLQLALCQLLQFKNNLIFLVLSAENVIHLLHGSFIFVNFTMKLLIFLHQVITFRIALGIYVRFWSILLLIRK